MILDYASFPNARLVTYNIVEAFTLGEVRVLKLTLPARKFFVVIQIRGEFVSGGGSAFSLSNFTVDNNIINAGPFSGNPHIYRGNDNTFQTTANTAFPACEIPVHESMSAKLTNSALADSYQLAITGILIDDPDGEFQNIASISGSP